MFPTKTCASRSVKLDELAKGWCRGPVFFQVNQAIVIERKAHHFERHV
jgi:hypothetical protein